MAHSADPVEGFLTRRARAAGNAAGWACRRQIARAAVLAIATVLCGCAHRPAGQGATTAPTAEAPEGRYVYLPNDVAACLVEAGKIRYVLDSRGRDYWQSPAETRTKGQGDCEDIAIFFQHLMRQRGFDGEVVFGLKNRLAKTGHAWYECDLLGTRYVIEPAGDLFHRRSQLPTVLYVAVNDVDSVREKVRAYHKRTGVYVNSAYRRAIESGR